MPCYPAFALLIGCVMDRCEQERTWNFRVVSIVCGFASAATTALLIASWNFPSPGDISRALTQHPSAYTLSLGHMGDLTIASFAYLRLPLAVASAAFGIGLFGPVLLRGKARYWALAAMMIVFLQAARIAMVRFDPYLSSRALASALLASPPGPVIFDDQYYTFSSVVFYTNKKVLLLNGRINNLEYGSNAPNAPDVFISDGDLRALWSKPQRCYLLAEGPAVPRLSGVLRRERMHVVAESGGKYLFTNGA